MGMEDAAYSCRLQYDRENILWDVILILQKK